MTVHCQNLKNLLNSAVAVVRGEKMIRYWLTLVLIFSFGVYSRGEEVEAAVRNARVILLTVYTTEQKAEFSVAFKKDDKEGLIFLFPCEDNVEVVINENLRNQDQTVDIEVLPFDLENLKFFRKIIFKVKDKRAAAELNEFFIKPFQKIKSCTSV